MVLTYGPREAVPHPGIYVVMHGKPHTAYRELFVNLDTFPGCRVCGGNVSFRLMRPVDDILSDADFRPDNSVEVRKSA